MSRLISLVCAVLLAACASQTGTIVIELDEGEFTVAAGVEKTHCVRIEAPPEAGDGELLVSAFTSELPVSTHHFFMAYEAEPSADAGPCAGGGAGAHEGGGAGKFLFGGGVGLYETTFPEGYALYLPNARGHFITDHHVLNLGDQSADMWGKFTMTIEPASEVPHPITSLACVHMSIDIPPHTDMPVTGTCVVPFDLDLVVLSSHGHQFLNLFETRIYDGEKTLDDVIYSSDKWDSPEIKVLDEPISLLAGQGLTFTCHYSNPTDETITWGAGEFGEMCATINGYAFTEELAFSIPPSLGSVIGQRPGDPELCDILGGEECCERHICDAVDTTHIDGAF